MCTLDADPVYAGDALLEGDTTDPYPPVGEAPPVPVQVLVALMMGPPGFVPFENGAPPLGTEQMLVSLVGNGEAPSPVPEPG